MTPERLNTIAENAVSAAHGPLMGRTEELGTELWWAIYRGETGKDGFKGKEPIAYVRHHCDAYFLTHAGSDISELIAEVKKLNEAIACLDSEAAVYCRRVGKLKETLKDVRSELSSPNPNRDWMIDQICAALGGR